jgi:hypothetical protein
MANVGTNILSTDYNTIRNKIVLILGTGLAQRGYGQQIFSSPVDPQFPITSDQWKALRTDLLNIRLHQTGAEPNIVSVEPGDLIEFSPTNPNNAYDTLVELSDQEQNRFQIASSRAQITSVASNSFTQIWKDFAETTLTVQFNNADDARYFFNSGGKIRFTSSRTGGTTSLQNTTWTSLLNSVGVFQFGAITPTELNFYSLTDQYQTAIEAKPSGIYSYGNSAYKIQAKSNVENNISGTATRLDFKISWIDAYPRLGDQVDGTLSLIVEELKAVGNLLPSGTFTILSPTSYSLLPITAT